MSNATRIGALFLAFSLLGLNAPIVDAALSPTITRAEFCAEVVQALDVPPVYPSTPDFRDVPPSAHDYGYIEAAYRAGIVSGVRSGVFAPAGSLTRAQAAKIEVLALGEGAAAKQQATAKTSFTDDGQVAAWARGYIAEAVALHLISGFPDGTFRPDGVVTTKDSASFIRKLADVWTLGAYSVVVTPSVTVAAVGQKVGLSARVTGRNGTPVWNAPITFSSTSPNVVISGHMLIASAPGLYTLTGSYVNALNTYTGMTKITVAGPPAAIRIDAPKTVLANGHQQTEIKVEILDKNSDIAVGDSGSEIELSVFGGAFAATSTQLTATDSAGVATFTLTDGSVPGAVSTLTARDDALPGSLAARAVVQSAAQVPAAITLTAPGEIPVNTAGHLATVDAFLEDTTGQAILQGDVPLTVTVTGPATLLDGTRGPETIYYKGNGRSGTDAAYAAIVIEDVQGETGQVEVQVSADGVPTKSATISAVVAGVPHQLEVAGPSATVTRDATAKGIAFQLSSTDQDGLPATTTGATPLLITVRTSTGAIAQGWTVDGQAQGRDGYTDKWALEQGHFTIADPTLGKDVGAFTVQVTDPSDVLKASSPVTFTATAGVPAGITAQLASTGLWVRDPKTTLTVQVVDAHGNPVDLGGVPVTVESAPRNAYPVAATPGQGVTDAHGVFSATVRAQPDVGPLETIDVSATVAGKTVQAFPQPVFMVQPWGP